ncbi:hypothetical protein GBN23_06940 [Plesiomonas shigelloides]|uniref:hypothetical protein n=1 Tax=Plesiomonas shigelloides TaxID=703 RepID=UPI0012629AA2|nr:hypothetical protein [Plesiomonas shigelloides]KAB7679407.1 hypothetical protein GBN23_06940 [Plesiomonas shigelloides]
MQITIIHLEDGMLISKENYESWREIQDEYETYKASLGPWEVEETIEYLGDEYANMYPSAGVQVGALLQGNQKTVKLTFNE